MVMFHASTVGNRSFRGRAEARTWSGSMNCPDDGTVMKGGAVGPCERVNTLAVFKRGLSCCATSTGRFCVAVCPKRVPNTPISKLRPYPIRTTVLELTSYATPKRGARFVKLFFT